MDNDEKQYTEEVQYTATCPSGCCNKDTRSSTAVEAAIEARPGLVTVHI